MRKLLTYIFIAIVLFSCSNSKEANNLFDKASSLMDEEHPDSAYSLLCNLAYMKASLSKGQQMQYELLTYIIHTFGHNVSFIESDFRITSSLIWLCNFFEESIPNKTMLMVEYRLGSRTSVRYRHESSLFPKEEFGERRLIV